MILNSFLAFSTPSCALNLPLINPSVENIRSKSDDEEIALAIVHTSETEFELKANFLCATLDCLFAKYMEKVNWKKCEKNTTFLVELHVKQQQQHIK